MTAMPAETLLTAEDLAALPDDGFQYELVRGKLIKMPPSQFRASSVALRLAVRAGSFIDQHRLGVYCGADCGVVLARSPDVVRAPDFAFIRADRIPPQGIPHGYWPGAPDLVVEVVSPSDRFTDVIDKVHDYLDAGARLVWVLDPEKRRAYIFASGRMPAVVEAAGVLDGEDVLPGFRLPLSDLWV